MIEAFFNLPIPAQLFLICMTMAVLAKWDGTLFTITTTINHD